MHFNNRKRRVVVTGIGAVTPLGLNAEETWRRMIDGESGIGLITQFDPDKYGLSVKIAGEVRGFELPNFLPSIKPKGISRCAQFALACSSMALEDSGLDLSQENLENIGVLIGSGIGGEDTRFENQATLLEHGASGVSVRLIIGTMLNESAARVAQTWGFRGLNLSIASACATGSHAIGEASEIIKRGDADVMIAGSAESTNSSLCISGFANMRALSKRNNEPEKASRPFDLNRDGFVMGEGAGIVILEEREHALRRCVRIYAEVAGYGATCDAHDITSPEPEGKEATRAMNMATEKAGFYPTAIDYINAHGTATPVGDPAEAKAIYRVFENWPRFQRSQFPPITSTKSSIGHLLGAAGAVEFIFCLLAIRNQIIPPTINLDNPDPECTLDGKLDFVPFISGKVRKAVINVALNNSFGFGGHNACLLVKDFSS